MNILVTGCAGFIAYHLIFTLLEQNHTIYGFDNFISGQKENIERLNILYPNNFVFKEFDLIDFEKLNKFIYDIKIDQIYHLACPASPPIYQIDPLHTLDTCYIGTRNILEIARIKNSKILLASTSEIYGDPTVHPQPENYWGNVNSFGLRSCYDEGKRVSETLSFIYLKKGIDVKIVRIFNTYGPKMSLNDGRVLTNFITQALRGENLTIYGDGSQTRSLCFCTDLIKGLLKLMDSNINMPINLGSQFEIRIIEIAEIVKSIINPDIKLTFKPLPSDDPKQRRPDITNAKKYLDWEPQVGIQEGISLMIKEFKERVKL
ncbi:GDP-mannose 4,6-dehydratase [Fluviispira sanaruensis]|uniref:UDP-glucuronate decarboxylase n=1 Tax=Fluviispira sanaruensis TaxID=2493639 RepID=A0A4V0P2Q5_FLUSA|nr:GDP-mannose 4,6-dehydratase [Fluviispira sanaruensis]BBH54047.1 NAD-dependent epimerase/dehydratase family protein [Fluviispira sanaruensis]